MDVSRGGARWERAGPDGTGPCQTEQGVCASTSVNSSESCQVEMVPIGAYLQMGKLRHTKAE